MGFLDDVSETATNVWDSASTAVSETASNVWNSASSTVSEVGNAASGAATDAWNGVSGAATSVWDSVTGPAKPEEPISVPVSPEAEKNAQKMVDDADAFEKSGQLNPYEKKKQQQDKDGGARMQGFPDDQARNDYQNAKAEFDKKQDAFLAGKGPNPGPLDEYMRKAPTTGNSPMYRPNPGGVPSFY